MSIAPLGSSSSIDATQDVQSTAPAGPVTAPDFGPEHPIEKVMASAAGDLFANKGLLKSPGIEDFRSQGAATAAMSTPLATPAADQPFGSTVVFRPGLANTHASPALLFRLARYTDKLLLAYPNAQPGQDLTPKPATEINGIPVPPELRGKIFTSGDPENRMVPWDDASQLFEKQLQAASGSAFLNGASVDDAKLTVVAHSQGGLDAADTRRRLESEGKPDEIGKLVTLNSPFGGSPIAAPSGFGLLAKGLGCAVGGEAPLAIQHLDPAFVKSQFGPADQKLVDYAATSTTDGPGSDNVRPLMKGLALANKLNPFATVKGPNDGFVTTDSMRFGQHIVTLPRAYDHAGIAEDPAVIDDLARAMDQK